MLQTILTELQSGDRANITEVLNAGVKKICEDFEKICLAGDSWVSRLLMSLASKKSQTLKK